jgi:transposase-like protein
MEDISKRNRRPRRRFDDDFNAQAVRLPDEGKSVAAVARDLDLTETALREWVHRPQADQFEWREHGETFTAIDSRPLRAEVFALCSAPCRPRRFAPRAQHATNICGFPLS